MAAVNDEYKDRLFSFIFGREENRKWTLELYNAINGSHYENPDDIKITTIEEVLYLGMHNDVSFMISDEMSLYEQQSTYNPNMPVRQLQYCGYLYEKYIKENILFNHDFLPLGEFAIVHLYSPYSVMNSDNHSVSGS